MRAPDTISLGVTTPEVFTLQYPQDGTSQPALYTGAAVSRALRKSLSALTRPISGDALSSVANVELVVPVVRTVEGASSSVALIRGKIEVRIPKEATSAEIDDFADELASTFTVTAIKAVVHGDRLV